MFAAIAAIALSAQGGSWPKGSKVEFSTPTHASAPPLAIFCVSGLPGTSWLDISVSAPSGYYWSPQTHAGYGVNGGGQCIGLLPHPGTEYSKFSMRTIEMTWNSSSGPGSGSEEVVLDGRTLEEKRNAPKFGEALFDGVSGDLYLRGSINLAPGETIVPGRLSAHYKVGDGPYLPMNLKWSGGQFVAYQRDQIARNGDVVVRIIYRKSLSDNDPNFAWGVYRIRSSQPELQGATSTSPPRNAPFNLRFKNGGGGVRG